MKFTTLVALFGIAQASKLCPCDAKPACAYAPQSGCGPCSRGAGAGAGAGYGAHGAALTSGLDAGARLSASQQASSYGVLCSENASSNTQLGNSNIIIPDKNTVTDQAKVSEAVSRGSNKATSCQVAQRKFSIAGEIAVTEKYSDSTKGEDSQEKCGEGSSQTRSRTQVLNNCPSGAAQGANAPIGCATGARYGAGYGCDAPKPSCGC
jgi:hypothetical protein